MNATRAKDLEDTARLILMDNPSGPIEFHNKLRAEKSDCTLAESAYLWGKYRGYDGRGQTHDHVTGQRL